MMSGVRLFAENHCKERSDLCEPGLKRFQQTLEYVAGNAASGLNELRGNEERAALHTGRSDFRIERAVAEIAEDTIVGNAVLGLHTARDKIRSVGNEFRS